MNYAVKNMIEKYGYSNQPFTVVLDDGYEKLCETFETVAPKATIKNSEIMARKIFRSSQRSSQDRRFCCLQNRSPMEPTDWL